MTALPYGALPTDLSLRHDPLTGFGTLLAFLERLRAGLDPDLPAARPLTILLLAVRGPAPDEAALRAAVALWRVVAGRGPWTGATAYHLGEGDFAALLPGTDSDAARQLGDDLLEHGALAGLPLEVGVGVAVPAMGAPLGHALRETQRALGTALADEDRLLGRLAEHVLAFGGRLAEAHRLAYVDPVSGLPNQQALAAFLGREIPRAVRYRRPLSLLLIDGDNLKDYNERLGYAEGDRWIRALGRTLAREVRASDLAARWRLGDEFAVGLPETGEAEAVALARRIRTAVEHLTHELPLPTTVSIGVATFPEDGATTDALVLAAERANRHAKAAGKNRIARAAGGTPEDG